MWKEKSGKGKKGGKKRKENHSGKGYEGTTTEHSQFDGECRSCGKYGHKASGCWYEQTNESQGESKGTGKSKSKVTEISESDNRKQVDEWNPSSNTSTQQPNFVSSEQDWMRRWGTLDFFAGRQQETSVHGELGSLVPLWLRSGKLRSTSWWSTLDVLDMSATVVCTEISIGEFYKRRRCGSEQRGTATLRTKRCTGTWWRTVENEFWSRSQLTWWTCANLSWALLHWNIVARQSSSITIYDRIIFRNETVNLVSHDCHSYLHVRHFDEWNFSLQSIGDGWRECDKWCGRRSLRQRWKREKKGSRSFSWWSTRHRRCGQLDISGEAKTARSLRTPEPPTDAARMAHNATHVHSEIGVQSVLRVVDEVLRTHELWWTRQRIHCRNSRQTTWLFEQWQSNTQPCITYVETRSGVVISFMCARKSGYEDLIKEILRHFEAYGFFNPVIIHCDKEMSIIDACRKVARERNSRTVLRFAPKTSHQSNGFVEAVHGHIQGLARCCQTQIETNIGVQLSTISPAIPFAIRYAGFVLLHSATRRQNPIPIFAWNTICITFVHVWWIGIRFDSRSRSACSQTDEQMDQWMLVGTRCIVRRTPGGDETWFAWVQISSQKTTWRTQESTWNDRSSRNEMEFWRGNGFWNTRTDSGTRWGNADSNSPDGNSYSTSTCTSAGRARTRDTSSQQQRRRRCGGQDGDGDLRPILHESCENESDWQSRPLHKHCRSTYFKAAERGRQIDRYWPDHHYKEVGGT